MNNTNLEKKEHYYTLFCFYSSLLTKKQQKYFEKYFINDFSLQEIAQLFNISRNAIHDSLVKTIKLLDNYENKLHLYKKYKERKKIYNKYQTIKFIKKLEEIDKI